MKLLIRRGLQSAPGGEKGGWRMGIRGGMRREFVDGEKN